MNLAVVKDQDVGQSKGTGLPKKQQFSRMSPNQLFRFIHDGVTDAQRGDIQSIGFGSLLRLKTEQTAACKAAVVHCKDKGKDLSKISLQFSLSNKDISTMLVGMCSAEQVQQNVAAAKELETVGIDQETLSELEDILKPVKNQTWPSGIQ